LLKYCLIFQFQDTSTQEDQKHWAGF